MVSKFMQPHPSRPGYQEAATIETSAGAGSADAIPSLGPNGTLDPSFMPPGITAPSFVGTSTEALAAGAFVNVLDNGGTFEVRLADNTNGRFAHGYVKEAFGTGVATTVFSADINDGLSGLTAGVDYWLGAAGAVTATIPVAAGTDRQYLGVATSATAMTVDIREPIALA